MVLGNGADYLLTLKANQEGLLETAQTLRPGVFFPPDSKSRAERTARTEEKNRGRPEIRALVMRAITPVELGLIGARQVARLDRHRTEHGATSDTQLWLATSRSSAALPPAAFLKARRDEWGIENGLYDVLDVSGDEDRRLRVRTLNHLGGLALLSRISVALWKHSQRERKRPRRYYAWREHQKARCGGLLRLLRTPLREPPP
jgi:hypothetical protein